VSATLSQAPFANCIGPVSSLEGSIAVIKNNLYKKSFKKTKNNRQILRKYTYGVERGIGHVFKGRSLPFKKEKKRIIRVTRVIRCIARLPMIVDFLFLFPFSLFWLFF